MSYSALLRSVPIFSRLRDSELKQLSKSMSSRMFTAGEVVVEAGESGDALYVIASGLVEVVLKGGAGEQIVLSRLGAGEHFGEMSLIDGSRRSATVRAIGTCELLRLDQESFLGAAELHPSIAIGVMRGFSRRLRSADEWIRELSRHTISSPGIGRDEDDPAMLDDTRLQLIGEFIREAVPFNRSLGFLIDKIEPGHVVMRVPWRDALVGDPFTGMLASGVISSLADAAGSAAAFAMLDATADRVTTVDLYVDFVRPGWEEDLVCEAQIVRMGNRIAQARMNIWGGSLPTDAVERANPIATARAVYSVVQGTGPAQPRKNTDVIELNDLHLE